MMFRVFALGPLFAAAVLLAAANPAAATGWQDVHAAWHSPSTEAAATPQRSARSGTSRRASSSRRTTLRGAHSPASGYVSGPPVASNVGPRPGKWCGWYMRTRRGGGPELNVAWNWRTYGRPAEPQVGAIVVWRHHVGEIVGRAADGRWLVHSGNDGGAVRTRPRSIAGAIIRM